MSNWGVTVGWLVGVLLTSPLALGQSHSDWDLDKGREPEKKTVEPEENADDVEQRNVGRVEPTEAEREARAEQVAEEDDDVPDPRGKKELVSLELGLRTGYAVPFGDFAEGGSDISTLVAGQVPFQLDVGVRHSGNAFFGLYFSYGLGVLSGPLADACDADSAASGADVSCSASAVRFGVGFHYHARVTPWVNPWMGAGFGYEWLNVQESARLGDQSAAVSLGFHGFEYFNAQLGIEFTVANAITLGPFILVTLGSYGKASFECAGNACAEAGGKYDVTTKSTHGWIAPGVKATFVL